MLRLSSRFVDFEGQDLEISDFGGNTPRPLITDPSSCERVASQKRRLPIPTTTCIKTGPVHSHKTCSRQNAGERAAFSFMLGQLLTVCTAARQKAD